MRYPRVISLNKMSACRRFSFNFKIHDILPFLLKRHIHKTAINEVRGELKFFGSATSPSRLREVEIEGNWWAKIEVFSMWILVIWFAVHSGLSLYSGKKPACGTVPQAIYLLDLVPSRMVLTHGFSRKLSRKFSPGKPSNSTLVYQYFSTYLRTPTKRWCSVFPAIYRWKIPENAGINRKITLRNLL